MHFGHETTVDGSIDDKTGLQHPWLRRRLLANVTGNTFRSSDNDNIGYGATYQFEVSLLNMSVSGGSCKIECDHTRCW
ncbi:hypothetical protein AHF37_10874 [Paragonimus kellicotti]|nr:hypothetical protein AHF37_10874 [Paragonimus kellicotti]